jgi:hypothetical protein
METKAGSGDGQEGVPAARGSLRNQKLRGVYFQTTEDLL